MDEVVGRAAPERFDVEVRCEGTPIVELVGQQGAFLMTDAGELLAVGSQARGLTPFATEAGSPSARLALASAAALDADGTPVLGTPGRAIAWFREGAWEVRTHAAPVLALGSSRAGVVAGDSAGELTVFDGRRVAGLHAGEPVVEIRAAGDHLGALGADGGLWLTRWPHDDASPLKSIDTRRIGRAFGLFSAPQGFLGVFGVRNMAIIDLARGRITAISPQLGEIRAVITVEEGGGYAVLDDRGELRNVDTDLRHTRAIPLPSMGVAVVGVRAGVAGAMLVWNRNGELFHVFRNGLARRLADEGVVLAYPTGEGSCVVVQSTTAGVRLRTESWG